MKLHMFEIEGSVKTWVVAENTKQAINIFKDNCGEDVWEETIDCYGDGAIRLMSPFETFTYYHDDGINPDKDTVENLILRYCDKPGMFATSEF